MGLFNFFKKEVGEKPAYKGTIENLVVGYLVTETSKLTGEPIHTEKFKELQASASKSVQELMIHGLNKKTMQEVFDTLSLHCPKNPNGAFGHYLIVLFMRFGHIQRAIVEGQVKPEEAPLDLVAQVLHRDIKKLIEKISSAA